MRLRSFVAIVLLCIAIVMASCLQCKAQAGFDDDRVMLQGFYWESYRHGHPRFTEFTGGKWYAIVLQNAGKIREGRFDMIWLPPPSFAGELSAGYNPKQYFNLSNSYGSFEQHRAMIEGLLKHGIEPIADIVINHRDGDSTWVDFKNPDWGVWAICRTDEAFCSPDSPFTGTPVDQRGAEEERPSYVSHKGTTYRYDAFRDIDHTNKQVRRDILKFLLQLKSLGYRGWRYDMVHGYHARWVALYNKRSMPTFSVGEYDWDKHGDQRGWIWHSATTPGDLKTASSVFDFSTFFALKDNKGKQANWYGLGNGLGMVGDNTDGYPWKQRSVTFLENHDTGYRTNDDGTPQEHHKNDSFQNNWEVEQAYAYILTHPGVPCVYWKHYFDWGDDLRNKIRALINARKVAGVHSGSDLHLQENALQKGVYAAKVQGKRGVIFVRVGGNDNAWQPHYSGFNDYREYARGAGWKVWVKLPNNPEVQFAPLNQPLEVPQYRPAGEIEIPDEWLNR